MKKMNGAEAFEEYFSSVYGDRWQAIHEALHGEDKKIARKNLFFNELPFDELAIPGLHQKFPELTDCYEIDESFDQGALQTSLLPYYRMDPASLAPALALEVQPGEKVLDMCAAPGGKSLILVEDLTAVKKSEELDLSGSFVANEMSAKRKHRMMSVFKRHLPKSVRQMIRIRGGDGSLIGLQQKDFFDRILLDAPCSGERGVVHKKAELATWKEKRTKSFGIRQYSLLSSAFMALKPGGRIVYSTCSISPHENDEVIKKLVKRKGEQVNVIKADAPINSDETEFGCQFLPDKKGWGPIFYGVVERVD